MSDFKNISDFRKSKLSKYPYQDPTYLSFLLMFDFRDPVNSPFLSTPAENFLKKLASAGGDRADFYAERLEALQNFKKALKTINNEMPWYWQGLSGLEKIQQYNPNNAYYGGDDSVLTITTLESINLPIAGLMHLYRKAVFDEEKWTWILPENLRQFRTYIYVTEVRTIKNIAKPAIKGVGLNEFPDNLKPSIKIENDNSGISGTSARPYFMFALRFCEWDLTGGTSAFADLQKSPDTAAAGEISFKYQALQSIESKVLNGIITSEFNGDNISPAPDSEENGPSNMQEYLLGKAKEKGEAFADRAVTDLKTLATNKVNDLKREAKSQTIGRLDAAVNNIYQDFVNGVDNAATLPNQTENISAAISENVHGLTEDRNTIGEALTAAAKNSLGNVYGN